MSNTNENKAIDLTFSRLGRANTASGIVEKIVSAIRENDAGRGTRLPNERKLAKDFGVSRTTLREALRMLSMLGLLDTRHGSGSSITDSSEPVIERLVELVLLLEKPSEQQLQETREIIEVALVAKATHSRTDRDLQAMRDTLDSMAKSLGDKRRFGELDLSFHELLYSASGNVILQQLMTCLRRQLRKIFRQGAEVQRNLSMSLREHTRIFEAIRDGDETAARDAMVAHMKTVNKELRQTRSNG